MYVGNHMDVETNYDGDKDGDKHNYDDPYFMVMMIMV